MDTELENLLKELEKVKKERDAALELAENRNLFISSISHEIRSPVNAILGMINIYLEENANKKETDFYKGLKFSAENLLKLLNDVLQYSRISSNSIELEEIEIDLNELLKRIEKNFAPAINEKKINFAIQIDPQIPKPVIGDSLRITQILTNLISNAIKFTMEGSVSVNVQFKSKKANLVELEFSVLDTGIGIPENQLEKIFYSFVQGEKSISRIYGGSGLGLAISKKLLNLMESNLFVESQVGMGSKFSFSLFFHVPLLQVKEVKVIEVTQSDKNLRGLKILLVEDNISNQKVAVRYLQKWEVETDVAENGIICLKKLEENKYDLILMDLQMPEMDGYTAAIRVRGKENPAIKEIPIIALTASVLLETKSKVEQAGMNEYLTKPFNPNELYNAIAKYYKKK